jgi:hypothetical protein
MFSLASRYARVQIADRFLFAFAHLVFCAAATVAREKRGVLGKLLGLPSVRIYRKQGGEATTRINRNKQQRQKRYEGKNKNGLTSVTCS